MHSKNAINKTKKKQKQKDKTKIENVGRPAAFSFTRGAKPVIKVVLYNPFATSKNLSFSLEKQAVGSFLALS